jgi:YVTN family beta-propeller protein
MKCVAVILCAILVFLCAGCQPPVSLMKPPLVEQGELFIYLERSAPEMHPLIFDLGEVAATRSDGSETPLTLRLTRIGGDASTRERFLASGVLPPGSYLGLSVGVRRAFLRKDGGETPLTVSEKPEKVTFPFEIRRKEGTVLSLTLRHREASKEGAPFHPDFSVVIPDRPLTTLTGYVTNFGANTITVFNKKTGSVRAVIETGQGPKGIVLDQKRMIAYAVISGEDAVDVIDVLSNRVVNRIRLTYGDRPGELALTPDGKTLLTANTGSNTVSFVDPATLLENTRLTVGNEPRSLLLDPTGKKAYVFNYLSNTISVIDIANKALLSTIATETAPLRGSFNRQGDRLLVVHEWSPNLIVIDPATGTIVKRVYVGMGNSSLRVDTRTDRIYLAKNHDTIVGIYDPFSLIASDFLDAAGGARYMLFDGDTDNLLLVCPDERVLQSVNLISKKTEYLIDVDAGPYWSTLMGER